MKCPKCLSENLDTQIFCGRCGAKLENVCPKCGSRNPCGYGFCGECGNKLGEVVEAVKSVLETEGERKYVTVLFSDLSGYTAMSERLDPEEVKEIMSRIFGEIAQVVTKYEGFIEKFIGDAVMALFGIPKSHEDDPIRAIKAAREIHDIVESLSPEVEKKIGKPISMHSGINTGLVITGKVDIEKGIHGVSGDTINLSSRLQGLAKRGEILVGFDTYRQAEGYFTFESLEPTMVKGKAEPVQVHKVLSQKDKPLTTHRLSGMRADLIGRKMEMDELREAVANLKNGRGRIFSICGDAGTGKSRLVEDFKATLDLEEIQWIEGHAYAYSQNIPYFPLIDLLSRVFHIKENDTPEEVRDKVESGMENLVGKKEDLVSYVGSLYSLKYSEIKDVSPEFWRSRLQESTQAIFAALAKKSPTVFFLEDLHWADPSFVELFRRASLEIRQPAIVLCVYRPTFNLFTSHHLTGIGKIYREIRLQDLSLSEAQDMLASLLKTESIPSDLKRLVQTKTEGNPFYLEELVNSLIESEALVRDNGKWKLTRPLSEADISSSIHSLISGRLDRLEKEAKRTLQEASVIGRTFLFDILYRIAEYKDDLAACLKDLEQHDLIRAKSAYLEVEYVFKHALTQEVVYNGLLKKERKAIHEQIGLTMETLFGDRVADIYETLAFHFKRGRSVSKAVDYLVKSGEKSLGRYALEESHHYFEQALNLMNEKTRKTKEEQELIIDLIIKWALVFYYRGDFKELTALMSAHSDVVEELDNEAKIGMFYAWLGFSVFWQGKSLLDSHRYLSRAVQLGEKTGNQQVLGYASAFLAKTCAELGRMVEGRHFEKKAREIARLFPSDAFLYMNHLSARGYISWFAGNRDEVLDSGRSLLEYGMAKPSIRCQMVGHMLMGVGHFMEHDFQTAIECAKKVLNNSKDPYYAQYSNVLLGMFNVHIREFETAEYHLKQVIAFCRKLENEYLKTVSHLFLGVVQFAKGHMGEGLKTIQTAQQELLGCHRNIFYGLSETILGNVYIQIVKGSDSKTFSLIANNLGFLLKNFAVAGKKAEKHLTTAIEVLESAGAKGFLGQPYLRLGQLHYLKGRREPARKSILTAIGIFKDCGQEFELQEAGNTLQSAG